MNLKSSVAAVLTAFCISIVSSSAQEEPLRFALLTDLHYSQGGKSVEDIRRCIRDVNSQEGLDFVLIGGDLTDFGTDEEIRDQIDQEQLPCGKVAFFLNQYCYGQKDGRHCDKYQFLFQSAFFMLMMMFMAIAFMLMVMMFV